MLSFRCRVKLLTWNSQALIQAISHHQKRAQAKMKIILRLVRRHDVICIQEAHGTMADYDRMMTD